MKPPVLAIPHPCLAQSHILSFLKISDTLLERGFPVKVMLSQVDTDVVDRYYSYDGKPKPQNLQIITYQSVHTNRTQCVETATAMTYASPIGAVGVYVDVGVKYCDLVLSEWNSNLSNAITDSFTTKDLVVLGDFTWPCSMIVTDLLEEANVSATRLLFSGTMVVDWEPLGLSAPIAQVPAMGLSLWVESTRTMYEPLSFLQRFVNVIVRALSSVLIEHVMLRPYNELRSRTSLKDGHSIISSMQSRAHLVLVPLVWGVEPPRSLPPNWKPIHPVLPGPIKPLDSELEAWIQTKCQNLVVISFGTQVTLSPILIDKIFQALTGLPSEEYCFIWQLQDNLKKHLLLEIPPNVLTMSWLPQNDLLGHSKTRAFVSHAGYGSLYEAAYHGVPMVAIPMFGDQEDNAARAVYGGWGVVLDKNKFSPQQLREAIQTVTRNSKVITRAASIGSLVRRLGGSGPDEVLNWIEYAIDHGIDHLMPFRTTKASLLAYNNIDVGLFLALVCFSFALLMSRCMTRSAKRDKEKSS